MGEAGMFMSKMLGNNTNTSSDVKNGSNVYKSPTLNSYTKCVEALSGSFTPEIIKIAMKMIEPHDQSSFMETKQIGRIYEEDSGGVPALKSNKILVVKGTYTWAVFAHLKTIEMWIEYREIEGK